ncbi:MAG: DUF5723 family protein [Bacteroidaceae bacterium]|nr:DUF5723 family protein [Bacteroidaceae bacterium]
MKRTGCILASALLTVCTAVSAQTLSGSYFLNGSFESNKLNPAMTPERTYFSLPMLGQIGTTAQSNIGLDDFLFNSTSDPNMLTTFMSSEVSSQQFLGALPARSQVGVDMDIEVFTLGFRAFGGFNYFDVSLKSQNHIGIPKSLFEFMKAGLSDGVYDINNVNVNTTNYAELALGHARKITKNLTVGAKVKFLAGMGYVDLNVDEIHAELGDNEWRVRTNASMKAAIVGSKVPVTKNDDGSIDEFRFDDIELTGNSGFGMAMDLGAVYDLDDIVRGLSVSAALTDLGSINWKNTQLFATDKTKELLFQGFGSYDITGDNNVMDDTMDKLQDDFEEMIKVYDMGTSTHKSSLGATARFGAEYEMPFMNWLSAGELISYRLGDWNYFESRTSLNAEPCKWFGFAANLGLSTYGTSLGWIINFHPTAFNFYIGSDALKYTKDLSGTPIGKFNANIVFGINVPVGKRI